MGLWIAVSILKFQSGSWESIEDLRTPMWILDSYCGSLDFSVGSGIPVWILIFKCSLLGVDIEIPV